MFLNKQLVLLQAGGMTFRGLLCVSIVPLASHVRVPGTMTEARFRPWPVPRFSRSLFSAEDARGALPIMWIPVEHRHEHMGYVWRVYTHLEP